MKHLDSPIEQCFRVLLGKGHQYASKCFEGGFIGVDFGFDFSLESELPEKWRDFNRKFISYWLAKNPGKSKVAAGLACGMTHTVSKGIKSGAFVLSPNGAGSYRIGRVISDYQFVEGDALPHRRKVEWFDRVVARSKMSDGLRRSAGTPQTVVNLTRHIEELASLFQSEPATPEMGEEDFSAFALEKHLEDFLVANWDKTELGREFDIYAEEGDLLGQQYQTDTGPLDVLAVSKDASCLLVIELKRGRASDVVVGQTLRYMGYVQDELAEEGQSVRGMIIALEDDQRLRRAISMIPNMDFYRYRLEFSLVKSSE